MDVGLKFTNALLDLERVVSVCSTKRNPFLEITIDETAFYMIVADIANLPITDPKVCNSNWVEIMGITVRKRVVREPLVMVEEDLG